MSTVVPSVTIDWNVSQCSRNAWLTDPLGTPREVAKFPSFWSYVSSIQFERILSVIGQRATVGRLWCERVPLLATVETKTVGHYNHRQLLPRVAAVHNATVETKQ